jgi:transposase-like protein
MPAQRPRVFSREFKEAAVRRILAGEKVIALAAEFQVCRKSLYDWWNLYERGGSEALRAPGRPRGPAAWDKPRVVRDRPSRRRPAPAGAGRSDGEPNAERMAELERKIGQQALDLDFFARALRHIKASAPPSDARGAGASSP